MLARSILVGPKVLRSQYIRVLSALSAASGGLLSEIRYSVRSPRSQRRLALSHLGAYINTVTGYSVLGAC